MLDYTSSYPCRSSFDGVMHVVLLGHSRFCLLSDSGRAFDSVFSSWHTMLVLLRFTTKDLKACFLDAFFSQTGRAQIRLTIAPPKFLCHRIKVDAGTPMGSHVPELTLDGKL